MDLLAEQMTANSNQVAAQIHTISVAVETANSKSDNALQSAANMEQSLKASMESTFNQGFAQLAAMLQGNQKQLAFPQQPPEAPAAAHSAAMSTHSPQIMQQQLAPGSRPPARSMAPFGGHGAAADEGSRGDRSRSREST